MPAKKTAPDPEPEEGGGEPTAEELEQLEIARTRGVEPEPAPEGETEEDYIARTRQLPVEKATER
jgi:hypothetical protein